MGESTRAEAANADIIERAGWRAEARESDQLPAKYVIQPIDFGKTAGGRGASMGGFGSGNWYRFNKKSTAEESLVLAMQDLKKKLHPYSEGRFTWTWASGNSSSIGYFVTWEGRPTVTLHYRWGDSEDVRIPVRLQATPTQFGGERWWFTCPLIVAGVPCSRRVGKLYLPPGARYFGCRKCHDLTYQSSQEAHQTERLFGRLRMLPDYVAELSGRKMIK